MKELVTGIVLGASLLLAREANAEVHRLSVTTKNALTSKGVSWPEKTDILEDVVESGIAGIDPVLISSKASAHARTGQLRTVVSVVTDGSGGTPSVSDWVPGASMSQSFATEGLKTIRATLRYDLKASISGTAALLPVARVRARIELPGCSLSTSTFVTKQGSEPPTLNPDCGTREGFSAEGGGDTLTIQVPEPERGRDYTVEASIVAEIDSDFGGAGEMQLNLNATLNLEGAAGTKIVFATPTFLADAVGADGGAPPAGAPDGGVIGPGATVDAGFDVPPTSSATPPPESSCAMSAGRASWAPAMFVIGAASVLAARAKRRRR